MTTTMIQPSGLVHIADSVTDLHAAMFNTIAAFAEEAGMAFASDGDVAVAALQPVSMAAVFADLCRELGIPAPSVVLQALN